MDPIACFSDESDEPTCPSLPEDFFDFDCESSLCFVLLSSTLAEDSLADGTNLFSFVPVMKDDISKETLKELLYNEVA